MLEKERDAVLFEHPQLSTMEYLMFCTVLYSSGCPFSVIQEVYVFLEWKISLGF